MIDFKVLIEEDNSDIHLKLKLDSDSIGIAVLYKEQNSLTLRWIEIKTHYQFKGMGTYLINYIIDNILTANSEFVIKVINEETLDFYFRIMKLRGYNTAIINQYVHNGPHYPTLIFPADMMHPAKKKACRSILPRTK